MMIRSCVGPCVVQCLLFRRRTESISSVMCAWCSLDPILVHVPSASGVKMSCVSFAQNTECILVGDSDGQVTVFQLRGMTPASDDQVTTHHQLSIPQQAMQCILCRLK